LLHLHTGSKFGKPYGGSSEKGKALSMEKKKKAQPLATAVTLPSQGTQSHASDAIDVDCAGKRPLIKCFNCGKLGHTSRNCREKREIRKAVKDEQDFHAQSQ
jgi:Zinc knuckle